MLNTIDKKLRKQMFVVKKENPITLSQISGMIEAQEENLRTLSGEQTLLSQYKECNEINDRQLRQAKNIKDLVSINVATINKQLFVQTRAHSKNGDRFFNETSYNLQLDPINFLQKVPQMGERDFLINQSILHNSTAKNKISEAVNRQIFIQQQGPRTSTNYQTQRHPQTTKSQNRGLGRLLPELPTSGFQIKLPTQRGVGSNGSMRTKNNRKSHGGTLPDQETQDQSTVPEDAYEFDSVQISGRGSQIDPVKCLQGIFKKHDYKKRNPHVNHIVEKYKQMTKSQHGRRGSRMIGTADKFTQPSATNEQAFFSSSGSVIDSTTTPTETNGLNFFQKQPRMSQPARLQPNSGVGSVLLNKQDQGNIFKQMVPSTAPLAKSRPQFRQNNNQDIKQVSPELLAGEKRQGDTQGLQAAPNLISLAKRQTMPISGSTPMQTEFLQFDASQRNQFAQKHPSSHVPQQTVTYSNKKPLVSPCVSDSLTQAQIDIREKLAAMKRLFDDEDNNAKDNLHSRTKGGLSRPESSDWDLHNHKLLYEETLEKRKRHMELVEKRFQTQGLEGEHPTPKNQKKQQEQAANKVSHNYEMQEEELRDFLLHRIADLKQNDAKSDTDQLKMFKFKASTISNLLPSGSDKQEQRRLAENYKRRFKKGDQIHQKQQIVQQRRIEHINNAQRIDLQHSMELLKKDLVSQRSKSKSRGPSSGSEDGSGSNSLPIKLKEGDQTAFSQSFNGGSSQGRGKARKPQDIKINTNLDEQEDLAVRSDGYSTQRNSIMIEHNHQKTRVSPMGGLQTETSPLIRVGMSADRLMSQEPDQRKPELIQIQQQVLVYSEPEQAKNDKDAYSEESAIIFYIASGNSIDSNGKRQNKYTQVMRQLDAIDKKFAKKSKMNKRGMKKETRKIIEKAKQDQMREEMQMFTKKKGTLDMTEQNQLEILESESDDDRIQNVHELINRSLQEEINGGAEKASIADVASQKKGSVIVVQVSQHGTSRNEYGSEQTQNEKPHTAVVKTRLGKVIGKNLSRSQSQNSNNSRINSENYLQSENLAESPTNPNYYKEKLDSAISQSIQRGTPITSVVVFNHGAQKYSDNNVETEKKENQDDRQLPNSFRKESTLSLNAPLGEESDHRYVDMKKLDMGVTLMEDLTNTAYSGRFTQLSINIAHSQAVPDAKQPNQPPVTTQEGFAKTNNINLDHSFVTGSQLSYFCPKRFNRFPRFTIFFKKGQKELKSVYGDDNTVSLNSDFLKFLSDKRPDQQTERSNATSILQQKERDSKLTYENTLSLKEKSQIQQTQEAKDLLKMPADVLQWNNYLKQKNFDPFDKVVLVKGIDNSILTSFRTLRGDNNTVSDTFKIVHRKFAPQTTNNSFFKTMMLKHVGKLPYQTMFNFRDLDEEEDIEDFDVFEENEDGAFKQICACQQSCQEPVADADQIYYALKRICTTC